MIETEGLAGREVHEEGKSRISIAPHPDWVDKTKVLNFDRKAGAPITFLLRDCRLYIPSRTMYHRDVTRLEGTQAVQQLSRVEIPFDPLTHSLVIHSIALFRNGVLKNHADIDRIEIIRREQGLDAGVVNGEISALLLLKDVRIGDVLDVEFSIIDEGSLFSGELSWIQSLGSNYPIGVWKLAWIDRPDAPFHLAGDYSDFEFSESEDDGLKKRIWMRRAMPESEPEPFLPPDVFPYPILQITPFSDWGQIVGKLLTRWNFEATDRKELDEELSSIREAAGDDEEKKIELAVAAARDAVRYQNYSPGLLSIVPENVSTIWERRFGDCKEKSLLLVWLLRELGIDAEPALVATSLGRSLPDLLPAPNLFDHVVTRVRHGGSVLWIDPTDSYRGGPVMTWDCLTFHHALPLMPGADSLIEIPFPPVSSLKVHETVKASRTSAVTRHQIKLTFQGRRADFMRGMLDAQGLAGTRRALKSFVETTRQGMEIEEDMKVDDDRAENSLIFELSATRAEGVKPHPSLDVDHILIAPFVFVNMLPGLDHAKRTNPLLLGNPDIVEQLVKIDHPDVVNADYPLHSVDGEGFKAKADSYMDAGDPVFRFVLEIKKDRVSPQDVPAYRSDLEKTFGFVDVSINVSPLRRKPQRFAAKDPEDAWAGRAETQSSGGEGLVRNYGASSRATSRRRRVYSPAPVPQGRGNAFPHWLVWSAIFIIVKLILLLAFNQ